MMTQKCQAELVVLYSFPHTRYKVQKIMLIFVALELNEG